MQMSSKNFFLHYANGGLLTFRRTRGQTITAYRSFYVMTHVALVWKTKAIPHNLVSENESGKESVFKLFSGELCDATYRQKKKKTENALTV